MRTPSAPEITPDLRAGVMCAIVHRQHAHANEVVSQVRHESEANRSQPGTFPRVTRGVRLRGFAVTRLVSSRKLETRRRNRDPSSNLEQSQRVPSGPGTDGAPHATSAGRPGTPRRIK